MRKKVLVALSGGVDSSVTVHLLKEQGYEVGAAVLYLSPAHQGAVDAAKEVAKQLDIPLTVVERQKEFEEEVIAPFCNIYREGKTPNPCIFCNPKLKFKALFETADQLGYDYVATGHYADLEEVDGTYYVKRSTSPGRDQSYMLYRLPQAYLRRLIFPLSALPKDEVRRIAASIGLSVANKPDSQEICFIPDNDYPGYIEARLGRCPEGDYISPEGVPCGKHQGILHYTVGQRKGLGIALGRPAVIKQIDPATDRIYLSWPEDADAKGVTVTDCVWTDDLAPGSTLRLGVKIRSVAKPVLSTVTIGEGGTCTILFDTPQRAPAPGQSAVCYDGERVVGGGYMEKWL